MSRRGGLGVRKSTSEKIQAARTYRLTGVQPGSRVAETDRYRRWHLGYRLGYIMRNSTTSVTVQWDGDEEFTHYTATDARYNVDTNRWRIVPPESRSPIDALTSPLGDASITLSPPAGANRTEEEDMAARKKAPKKVAPVVETPAPDELDDDELDDEPTLTDEVEADAQVSQGDDDDELDDEEVTLDQVADAIERAQGKKPASTPEPSGETYTAKQVATRIGTDSKTLRKFFRSPASTVEPVGQGGRYEFDKSDLPKIKAEFDKWNTGKTTKAAGAASPAKKGSGRKSSRMTPAPVEVTDEDEELDLDDELEDEEPTAEALADVELDDELDDEELDD